MSIFSFLMMMFMILVYLEYSTWKIIQTIAEECTLAAFQRRSISFFIISTLIEYILKSTMITLILELTFFIMYRITGIGTIIGTFWTILFIAFHKGRQCIF